MAPVRGVSGRGGNFKTSDGVGFQRLTFANIHQRNINKAGYMERLMSSYGLADSDGKCNPSAITLTLRTNSLFRKRFMLAVNY